MELNSREVAVLLWLGIGLALCVVHPGIRGSLINLLRAATQRQLLLLFGLLSSYVAGVVAMLNLLSLWDWDQLKNVLFWLAAVGITSMFSLASLEEDSPFFRNWVRDNLRVILIFEFVVTFYAFPFLVEFLLQPAVAFIAAMIAVAGRNEKYSPARKLLDSLMAMLGMSLVGYTVYMLVTNFGDFVTLHTLRDFYTPILLSLAFLPFIWALHIFMTYERIFAVLKFVIKDDYIRRYAKWRAILAFGPSTTMLRRWHRYIAAHRPTNQDGVLRAIVDVKSARRRERRPVPVPVNNGWSPDRAKRFLEADGIVTRDYHRLYDEWCASSNPIELGDGVIPDNVAYCVDGDELVASKLRIVLNVYNPETPQASETRFAEVCAALVQAAIGADLPGPIAADFATTLEGKLVSLRTERWSGGIKGGYEREFTIAVPAPMVRRSRPVVAS